jgi:hypothetical protein
MIESSQLKEDPSSVRQCRTKFTPENIRQITNLVERGTSPVEIAEIIGVTLGTLKTTCSKFHISLRRPSYDTGTGLLRHRRGAGSNGASLVRPLNGRTCADTPNAPRATGREIQPMEHRPTEVPQDKAPPTDKPFATFAIAIQYKGDELAAELRLTREIIAQFAIEAGFREMNLAELMARTIESVATKDQFHLVLGELPKRVRDDQ